MLGLYSNKRRTTLALQELLAMEPDGPAPTSLRHGRQRRRSVQTNADILATYREGTTVSVLAEKYGINRRTVSAVALRGGGSLRYRLIGPKDLILATDLYESGMSVASIANRPSVAPNTVRSALRGAGVAIRDRHRRVSE